MAAEENGKKDKLNNAKKTRVIPGYHLTLGIVIAMLSLIVLIPLASVLVSSHWSNTIFPARRYWTDS